MKKLLILLFIAVQSMAAFSQKENTDSLLLVEKDSTFKAMVHADSMKVEKQYKENSRWAKIDEMAVFPALNAGKYSGIIPVSNPTEVPDPRMDYKLLFELTSKNPDSTATEINYGLTEVARIINLHVAAGIPLNKIMPVLVVHAGALTAISNNEYYKNRYKTENPNLKILADLEKMGARIIACGQAMTFFNIKKEELLPEVKVSVTAQTALSSYQLKGYVWYDINTDKR